MSKGRKEHHEEHIDETWLIPYADLLTLLLALFIILFAASKVDAKKYDTVMKSFNAAFTGGSNQFEVSSAVPIIKQPSDQSKKEDSPTQTDQQKEEQLKKEQADLTQLKQKLDQYISQNNLTAELETTLNNDMLMITIRDNALFASGSAAIKPESRLLAVAISGMLSQYPEYRIEVAGHTDNVPIKRGGIESNWDLSSSRALNFMKILLENGSLDPSRFRSIGYGEYHPVESNATAEGRTKNRRVEVSIMRGSTNAQTKDAPK
jgi:chemotaxis protein MotB